MKKQNRKSRPVGFSHGALYKIHDVYSMQNIQLFENCGCTAIEINFHRVQEAYNFNKIVPFIKNFQYVSMHAPCDCRYGNNVKTRALLKLIESMSLEINAELVVVHPDLVDDWTVFDNLQVSWAIENMDERKDCYKNVADLQQFLNHYHNWGLVLDLGHANVNDKTMVLADDIIKNFQNKIKEIHLSGYKTFHDPLYQTRQVEIIERCKQLEVPIIIESTFALNDGVEGVQKEFNYIRENLK